MNTDQTHLNQFKEISKLIDEEGYDRVCIVSFLIFISNFSKLVLII